MDSSIKMDGKLCSIFAKKLQLSETTLQNIYIDALKEFLNLNLTETVSTNGTSRQKYCMYKYVSGENSGKLCGLLTKNSSVEATCELEGKNYCKSHFKSVFEKKKKSESLKLTGINKPFVIEEKLETENMGDFEVLKDTMLIIDRSKNCCSGKLIKGQPTHNITVEDESLLKSKNVEFYKCKVEKEDHSTSELSSLSDEPVEKIDLESLVR